MNSTIKRRSGISAIAAGLALAAQGVSAFDITETYDFAGNYSGSAEFYGHQLTAADEDANVSASVSGWYGTDEYDTSLQNETDEVVLWGGGLGINYTDDSLNSGSSGPNDNHHTIDNADGKEYLAIELEEAASLHSVTFGWREQDSDFSVFYLKAGETYDRTASGISRDSFEIAAHWEGAQSTTTSGTDQTINLSSITSTITSAVWLIAGYVPNIGGQHIGHVDNGSYVDGFKLASVVTKRHEPPQGNGGGNGGDIPLPATAALFGLGLLFLRKPRAQRSNAGVALVTA